MVGQGASEDVLLDIDFEPDEVQAAGEVADLGHHPPLVLAKHRKPVVAFAASHPAVTSVILGPRTMQQFDGLVSGASLTLDDDTAGRKESRLRIA